jgi:hypothetical protein
MRLLRQYIRELLTEALTRPEIEDAIQDASFNSNNSSSHRWSRGQPMIDYYFDEHVGNWKFQAAFPDSTNDADKWLRLPEIGWSDENIETFLSRVETFLSRVEEPIQLNLFDKDQGSER